MGWSIGSFSPLVNALYTQREEKYSMSKTKILNLRIDPDLKKAAKKLAEADGRTLSNWVTRLIQREVETAKGGKSK